MTLRELAVAELTLGDIGSRVMVIDTSGNAYSGVLTDIAATEWKFGKRDEEKIRIRISAKSENSELKLDALPTDFRLQIELDEEQP